MNKEIICIACPMGCHLTVVGESPDSFCVTGNKCAKGAKYGLEEATNPKRVVTYVVRSNSESLPFVPVRTDDALPKELIPDLIADLNKLRVNTPFNRGDVVLANFANTSVNVVATRTYSGDL
jgi:CxxC motif-containing protein